MNKQPTKVRCVSQPRYRNTLNEIDFFTIGKEYHVKVLDGEIWQVISDSGEKQNIRNPKFDMKGETEWWTNYFVIVDDHIDAYDRAMGII